MSHKKSDHKHVYNTLVLVHDRFSHRDFYYLSETCYICGKQGSLRIPTDGDRWLSSAEILEMYKYLPLVERD